MRPQYLWIDTPHAYGRTTLKFRFLMGIFKFSDPMYRGSNIIVHQIQNFPQLLYIKLHLKMSGNINFFQFWVILGHLVPPLPLAMFTTMPAGWLGQEELTSAAASLKQSYQSPSPAYIEVVWSAASIYVANSWPTPAQSLFLQPPRIPDLME